MLFVLEITQIIIPLRIVWCNCGLGFAEVSPPCNVEEQCQHIQSINLMKEIEESIESAEVDMTCGVTDAEIIGKHVVNVKKSKDVDKKLWRRWF